MVMQNSPNFLKEIASLPACSLPVCQIALANENFFLINANSAFHLQFSRKNRNLSATVLPKLLHEACVSSSAFVMLTKQLKLKGELENYDLRYEDGARFKTYRVNAFQHQNTAEHAVWTIYFQDVSDLAVEIENAKAASKMKSLFLATMSHEIRTPMQPLYGLLEIMQQEATDTRQAGTINAAKGAASALLQILDDVLDLAKIEAGKMDLDYFEVPLRTLIDGIMTTLSQKAKEKGIHLSCEFASDLPRVVMGDPKRLRQVIMNLVVNALKFTERGSVVIRLKCQDFKEDGQHFTLCCEVEDSGIGISPELLPHLFEPFTQGDFSTTRRYRGTGLGLSITHRLLQLMNGAIGVSSMEGQGSLFWFNIPTSAVAQDALQVGVQPDLRGVHVLLVEDHPQGAKTIMMTLQSMGATVIGVETIEDALERSETERFDVAIVDYLLPDGSGLSFIETFAKIQPNTGLLMYTVFDSPEIQETLKSLGALHVAKPASRLGLGQAVETLTNKVQYEQYKGSRKVLIAEDTPIIQDVIKRQLEYLHFTDYVMVSNGVEALNAMQKQEFGLILADLHMPEMDGYQLVEKLRHSEQFSSLPIIALTADVQLSNAQAYLKHGFNECLVKVSIAQLRRMLLRWGILEDVQVKMQRSSALPSLNKNIIDEKAFIKQLGVFDRNSLEALELFVRLAPPLLDGIGDAIHQEDGEKLRDLAHALKGSARAVCCPELGNLAETLQDSIAKESDTLKHLVAEIEKAFKTVEGEVKRLSRAVSC